VLVLHERKSRATLATRLAGKTAAETISVMLAVFARIEPALRKSIVELLNKRSNGLGTPY
jgi:transposase, IS30 family